MQPDHFLHPATRIIGWAALAACCFTAAPAKLVGFSLILGAALTALKDRLFVRFLKRMRWILVSIFLIYGFSTPGAPLVDWLGDAAPTAQGVTEGAMQAWRIALTLALLAVLQATTGREQMLSGLYALLLPVGRFGVDAGRIAVRLMLTMRYAEEGMDGSFELGRLFSPVHAAPDILRVDCYRFGRGDALAGLLVLGVMLL